MTRRGPSSDASLDRLLGRMPEPEVPADLAQRIIAATASLPQQKPRETVIAVAQQQQRPLGHHAFGQRIAGLSAFAAAACLAMVLLPLGVRKQADPVAPSSHAAPSSASPVEKAVPQSAPEQVALAQPVRAHAPPRKAISIPALEAHKPAPLSDVPASAQHESAETSAPPFAPQLADAAPPAEAAGPKAPVQGPPTPFDLAPAGRPTTGLGVAGVPGGASVPAGGGGMTRPR